MRDWWGFLKGFERYFMDVFFFIDIEVGIRLRMVLELLRNYGGINLV